MQEIIREYAEGIKTTVIVGGLFFLLFSSIAVYGRFRDIAYAQTSDGMKDRGSAALEYAGKEVPQLKVSEIMELNKRYQIMDVFVDSRNNRKCGSIRIMELWYVDDSGSFADAFDSYDPTAKTLLFEKAGTYKAKISFADQAGVTNTQWIYFITEE